MYSLHLSGQAACVLVPVTCVLMCLAATALQLEARNVMLWSILQSFP